jgi:hypothetical protein|tara:strand:+ start:505 stop:1278 length:774 start_codon:yes stop_codon:yes gene_type:complete
MIKKRLFTFGCSHTYYYWPTWANILSLGADEFYNFGWPGTGDFRILNQVMRANERFKFGKNDYIGIGMSCNHRYDTIDKRGRTWVGLGGMADEKYHKVRFIKELNELGGNENKLTIVKSIKKILNDTDANYKIFQGFKNIRGVSEQEQKISDELTEECTIKQSLYDYSYPYGRRGTYKIDNVEDGHYIIPIHLDLVKGEFGKWYDSKHDSVVMDWHKQVPKYKRDLEKVFHWLRFKQYSMIGSELRNPQYDGINTLI